MNQQLISLLVEMQEEETIKFVKKLIAEGADPNSILDDARAGMEIVGQRFEKCEYFIPDLMMAGEILKGISDIVKPLLKSGPTGARKGKVLIGTVAGDIHDIGKDIVTFMLDVNGYDVMDMGIDVPVPVFVEKVKEFKPQVVGLSGFLTLAFDSMKKTVCMAGPQEVRDYCKRLIDIVGKDGGYILNGDIGIADEAKPEDVRAMVDFVREYGVYGL